ncbi:MAG: dTDP-glucose 4,6-dehydratase [Desulfobacteraceae bacterium]|nr:dTDP-glucose 4,6-dehydratase [Desulfobacteraceae bacterium]MCB9494751.1 dTDP-glucose 4,6-dehydratase [Desulfobacteraceae bacterium]
MYNNILVTGGCGFIGSNFIRTLFKNNNFKGNIINIDKLTYAANPLNLSDIEKNYKSRYFFEKSCICNFDNTDKIFKKYNIDCVVHFAAESHVDRSIESPLEFINTNITGTFSLLETARQNWKEKKDVLFHHISTDEVYGSLGETGFFYESTCYDPRSPYSASKASSDHLVRAYFHTYNLPVTITNCSNNYGPYQFPEKLIPFMILNMIKGKNLPVYGDGKNVRDWIYVDDHNEAVIKVIEKGIKGQTYNIGGETEMSNIDIVNLLCESVNDLIPASENKNMEKGKNYKDLIKFVKDRPGHDRRYAINCDKIKKDLSFNQSIPFEKGIKKTVEWYLNNTDWVDSILTGEYKNWIKKNYSDR